MKNHFLVPALFLALLLPAKAAILAGAFDFFGQTSYGAFSTGDFGGTATFTYETTTNLGTIQDFYWFGGTAKTFQFMVMPTAFNGVAPLLTSANAGNFASVTDFADLTDFGLRSRLDSGQIETYYNDWVLIDNGVSPGYHIRQDQWSYAGSNPFNPPVAYGTATHFMSAAVPEPGSIVLFAGLPLLLACRRRK